ncbi:MAG: hypothetical protein A2622_07255 [Bdellovibrionales bacterium RIFCSPHIGHO2_01_FULL_40_29]|nr:MAG: hypothetical protein A2622_07255 [Bdellovibrionales bacterium RIFCSPHIGHO2_01_FULL_40_29]OFZ33206.1 MAG: hypothetical protein A3D17_11525 [Bdellovibrionales bacterium RIFCSPHIGHO2_02_FULL_40_15]
MKVTVHVKPHARKESVEKSADGSYIMKVNVPPIEGRANERVIEILSQELKIPKSRIKLVTGHKSKRKVFLISTD